MLNKLGIKIKGLSFRILRSRTGTPEFGIKILLETFGNKHSFQIAFVLATQKVQFFAFHFDIFINLVLFLIFSGIHLILFGIYIIF